MEECLPIWRVAANILNKQSWTAYRVVLQLGGEGGEVLTMSHCKNVSCVKMFIQQASDLDYLPRHRW